MPRFTRDERLRSKILIDCLFSDGKSFFVYPFKVFWHPASNELKFPAQLLIGVPRKNIRHAVKRNLMKRRIREVFRKNKNALYQQLDAMNRKCLIALIFTGREAMQTSDLEPKIIIILQRLIEENVKTTG